MRIAWFSPLSAHLSGIAEYSASILAKLCRDSDLDVDVYVDDGDPAALASRLPGVEVRPAHDFVWRHAGRPHDLAVYQLADAVSHAYMWGYAVRYPGLAVLHDMGLHAARRAQRTGASRGEHRAELRYDRPELHDGVEGIAALRAPHLLARWPLLRPILDTARRTAVHDPGAAEDLRRRYPGCRVDVLRFGVAAPREASSSGKASGVGVEFAAVAHTSRVGCGGAILRALRRVRREAPATLRIAGPFDDGAGLAAELAAAGLDRDAVVVADTSPGNAAEAEPFERADVCIALPAHPGEVTDLWMRCLAAGRATIVGARARLASVPLLDASSWRNLHGGSEDGVAVGIDPRREAETLWLAMRRLAVDGDARRALGRRARAWWEARSGSEAEMLDDYRRLIHAAVREPAPPARDLPPHFRVDGLELARRVAEACGLDARLFGPTRAGDV